jgi:hypothetical protein
VKLLPELNIYAAHWTSTMPDGGATNEVPQMFAAVSAVVKVVLVVVRVVASALDTLATFRASEIACMTEARSFCPALKDGKVIGSPTG